MPMTPTSFDALENNNSVRSDENLMNLIKEINELKDNDSSNDPLENVFEKNEESLVSKELNNWLKKSLLSIDDDVFNTFFEEVKKFSHKEWVYDLIANLVNLKYERSVAKQNEDTELGKEETKEKVWDDVEWGNENAVDNVERNNKNAKLCSDFMSIIKDEYKNVPLEELIGVNKSEYISNKKLDDLVKNFDDISNEELDDFEQYLRDPINSEKYDNLYCVLANQTVQNGFFKAGKPYIIEMLMKIHFDKNHPENWWWIDENERIYYSSIRSLVEDWKLKSNAIKEDNGDLLVSLDGKDYIYSNWDPSPLSPIFDYCVQYPDGVYFWMLSYVDWQVKFVEWWNFVLKNGDILNVWENWSLNRVEA